MDHKLSLCVEYRILESPSSSKNNSCKILDHNDDNDAEKYIHAFYASYLLRIKIVHV